MSNICMDAACYGCPDWVVTLAVIGGILVYALIGWLIYNLIKAMWKDLDDGLMILCIIFWPIIIAGGIVVLVGSAIAAIIYYVGGYLFKLFMGPVINVDKADLRASEDRIIAKIDTKITKEDNKIMDYLEYDYTPKKLVKAKAPKKAKAKAGKKKGKK